MYKEFIINDIICLKKNPKVLFKVIDKFCLEYKSYRYVIMDLTTKNCKFLYCSEYTNCAYNIVGNDKRH